MITHPKRSFYYGLLTLLCAVVALAGCSESSTPKPTPKPPAELRFFVIGTVSGLAADDQLTVKLNNDEELPITENGEFKFKTRLETGDNYSVEITNQPATQECSIEDEHKQGQVGNDNVTGILIECVDVPTFTIGGTIDNLLGTLTLQLNEGEPLAITQNPASAGANQFHFSKQPLKQGVDYSVRIVSQPENRNCNFTSENTGQIDNENIDDLSIACEFVATFDIGGEVTGLGDSSNTLTLKLSVDNDAKLSQTLEITGSGEASKDFTFAKPIKEGAQYSLSVEEQPENKICTPDVATKSGQMGAQAVDNLLVECITPPTYAVGGQVHGLGGNSNQLTLKLSYGDNQSETRTLTGNGNTFFTFNFATKLRDKVLYSISLEGKPESKECDLNNNVGTINGEDMKDLRINCVTTYSLGGTVNGLLGSLTLQLVSSENAEPDTLTLNTGASDFAFSRRLPAGTQYTVTVSQQPDNQQCLITSGIGTVQNSTNTSITSVKVTCAALQAAELNLAPELTKTFHFSWGHLTGAVYYRLKELLNADMDNYQYVGEPILASTADNNKQLHFYQKDVPLYARNDAVYMLETCYPNSDAEPDSNPAVRCKDSSKLEIKDNINLNNLVGAIGYVKASNTGEYDRFGWSVSLNKDGTVMAVGAPNEDGPANSKSSSGAVYIYTKDVAGIWKYSAYLNVSGLSSNDAFGASVSLDSSGQLLAVGVPSYDSTFSNQGAVILFHYNVELQQWQTIRNYLYPSQPQQSGNFGISVSLSGDGTRLAVGADENRAYLFKQSPEPKVWSAMGGPLSVEGAEGFGSSVSINEKGTVLAVGAPLTNNSAGTAYLFSEANGNWSQENVTITARFPDEYDHFGASVSLNADGDVLAVGAIGEDGNATSANGPDVGNTNTDDTLNSGAAYVYDFNHDNQQWEQQAYIKASNTGKRNYFGQTVSLSDEGDRLVVGLNASSLWAIGIDALSSESGSAIGLNGNDQQTIDTNSPAYWSGAAYSYILRSEQWQFESYIKASNPGFWDHFGSAVDISGDGNTMAVSAVNERGGGTGVNPVFNDDMIFSGAVYLY